MIFKSQETKFGVIAHSNMKKVTTGLFFFRASDKVKVAEKKAKNRQVAPQERKKRRAVFSFSHCHEEQPR